MSLNISNSISVDSFDSFLPSRDINDIVLHLEADDPNTQTLDSTDVVSLLDKSESLAETNIKTFDFSTDEDSLTQTNLILTGGQTIVDGGGTSKTNVLKGELTGGVTSHQIRFNLTNGKTYNNDELWVYVPTSNTSIDGVRLTLDTNVTSLDITITTNLWTKIEFKGVTTGILRLYATNGGNVTTGSDGDLYYIASGWQINEIEGNHFTQVTSANRPVIDNATNPTKVTFTAANSEYLENTLDVSSFLISQGSITWVSDGLSGRLGQFGLGDGSSDTQWMQFGIIGNKATMSWLDSGVTYSAETTTSVIEDDIITVSTDSSIIKMYINGIEDVVVMTNTTNTGQFLDEITSATTLSIGRLSRLSSVFYDTILRELIITSTPLTDAQSLDLSNYLINKHGL